MLTKNQVNRLKKMISELVEAENEYAFKGAHPVEIMQQLETQVK